MTLNTVTGGQLWPFQDEKPNIIQAGVWSLIPRHSGSVFPLYDGSRTVERIFHPTVVFRNAQRPQAAVESAACHCAEGSGAPVFHQLPCLRSRESTRLLAGQSSAFSVGGEHTAGSTLNVSKGSPIVCSSASDADWSFRRRTQNVQSQIVKLWKMPNSQGTKKNLWKLRLTSAVNFLDIQLRTDDSYCRSDMCFYGVRHITGNEGCLSITPSVTMLWSLTLESSAVPRRSQVHSLWSSHLLCGCFGTPWLLFLPFIFE